MTCTWSVSTWLFPIRDSLSMTIAVPLSIGRYDRRVMHFSMGKISSPPQLMLL